MGTNYYHEQNYCEHCGRRDLVHIGKSSYGWTFSFHGTETIRSWADWKKALQQGRIFDEGGEPVTVADFEKLVESKRGEKQNHVTYCRREHPSYAKRLWMDDEGHGFSDSEFS